MSTDSTGIPCASFGGTDASAAATSEGMATDDRFGIGPGEARSDRRILAVRPVCGPGGSLTGGLARFEGVGGLVDGCRRGGSDRVPIR